MEEEIEEQNSEVAGDDNTDENQVGTDLTVDDYKKLEAKNKELYQRAKKAEGEAKELKAKSLTKTNQEQSGTVTKNEIQKMLLQEKGISDVVLEEAETIARAKGVSINEALKTPAMVALVEKVNAEAKRAKSALGASGGSGSGGDKFKQGMTEEEHRKAWQEFQR